MATQARKTLPDPFEAREREDPTAALVTRRAQGRLGEGARPGGGAVYGSGDDRAAGGTRAGRGRVA